ncbi:MAG TPA: GGDEF domain-containing protein [Spongiibacteraceae bacterium]|nr:GGDEF domain-containing protein [Spongiibacteraceae bacterium]
MTKNEHAPTAPIRVASSAMDETELTAREQKIAQLRFANLLMRSLDIGDVLRVFASEMMSEFALEGAAYHHNKLDLKQEFGHTGIHRCEYELSFDKEYFGELLLTRNKRFSKRDLERMELNISNLMPALRNALQYLNAMQTATRDALTGVGNRIALEITAEREIAIARRSNQPTALLVIDIDHFKRINDRYGHSAGDRVLVETAQQLRKNCRESDSVFRFGGEEFVVLLNQTDENGACAIAERIRNAIATMSTQHEQTGIHVTASIGIACLSRGEGLRAWFDRADRALYLAKQAGRNRVVRAAQREIA